MWRTRCTCSGVGKPCGMAAGAKHFGTKKKENELSHGKFSYFGLRSSLLLSLSKKIVVVFDDPLEARGQGRLVRRGRRV